MSDPRSGNSADSNDHRRYAARSAKKKGLQAESALQALDFYGAGNRNRTYDLRITNAPLYQLSYSGGFIFRARTRRVGRLRKSPRGANSRRCAAFRSIDQLQPQLLGQREDHVLRLTVEFGHVLRAQLSQALDHAAHQHFRRGSTGGDAHDVRCFYPFRPQLATVRNQITWNPALRPDLAQAVGIRAVFGPNHQEDIEDVQALEISQPQNVAFTTQTTLSVDDTRSVIEALKTKFPHIQGPKNDDICYATQNRQDAVRELAARCDLVLVVGSINSSNSNRLRELAEREGVAAYLIDGAVEIDPDWVRGRQRIGVTAGASAPDVLVRGVIERLRELGAQHVTELDGEPEDMVFALPKELRLQLVN